MNINSNRYIIAYLDNHMLQMPYGYPYLTIDAGAVSTVKAHKNKPKAKMGYWHSNDECYIGTARCWEEEQCRNRRHYYQKRMFGTNILLVPDHHRYITRDDDGAIWSFSEEPKLLNDKWQAPEGADCVVYITDAEFASNPRIEEIPEGEE